MHADIGQVLNLVIHCTKCGVYNSTDRLSGRMAEGTEKQGLARTHKPLSRDAGQIRRLCPGARC